MEGQWKRQKKREGGREQGEEGGGGERESNCVKILSMGESLEGYLDVYCINVLFYVIVKIAVWCRKYLCPSLGSTNSLIVRWLWPS